MTTVLEELTADTLSRDLVERRLDDWAGRIDDLFTQIVSWVSPCWTAVEPRRTIRMDEEPMREVGLEAKRLPVLDLCKNGQVTVSVVPRGLWIIGANGRLDVSHLDGGAPRYLLVDEAENFEPPKWRVVSAEDRLERRPLDKATLLSVL